ncbi:MAG: hypothetical protein ABSF44_04415 [Candidatus Bathyarchaeia archaeon]
MKTSDMFRRVENLTEKLKDSTTGSFLRVDFNSFSEAEKALFRKGDEVSEEYYRTGNTELLVKNDDLIYRNIELMWKRITELYCYTVPMSICGATGLNYEIVNYFLKLHFLNFETDLFECVGNLLKWEESDRQEFLSDLKKNGPVLFRIPRGFNDYDNKTLNETKNSEETR